MHQFGPPRILGKIELDSSDTALKSYRLKPTWLVLG